MALSTLTAKIRYNSAETFVINNNKDLDEIDKLEKIDDYLYYAYGHEVAKEIQNIISRCF